jgi:DNA-binding MarR family transcriptional regulator
MNSAREGGSLVSRVHQLSGRVFSRVLKEHGIDELNPAQGRILFELWKEDGMSQATLASRTKLDKSTLALMLERLEDAGQVERVPDEADARRRIVRATKANKALHGTYDAASREMTEIFYGDIGEAEADRFERTLRKILDNLDRADSAPG